MNKESLSNFGWIEETKDLSCIVLAVPNIFGVSTHENKNCTYKKECYSSKLYGKWKLLRHSYNDIGPRFCCKVSNTARSK